MVSFRHGYHGDTMACMSVCDPDESMHALFKHYLPRQILAELPMDQGLDENLNVLLEHEKGRIAAVLIEPLVQGAGGMKFHSAEVLRRVADACQRHGALLIADEIFVGFGRIVTLFACEQAGITPDILCLGKGLTGGALSLAATLARPHVYEAFLSDDPAKALMHGPTFMANPLACAAANASLDLFETEPRLKQVARIETLLREGLEPCRNFPGVVDVRVKGAIGVVQLASLKHPAALREKFVDQGVWIRPFGDIVYLTPAFSIAEDQLATLTGAICSTLAG
jgi:adenosylmethionine-8-amino-7-oxononanoate aminotransferase